MPRKKTATTTVSKLHPRSLHLGRYDFELLLANNPSLQSHVLESPRAGLTIDFSNAQSVLEFNRSLLMTYYGLKHWNIDANNLCPPIPGRADYLHYLADLIDQSYGLNSHVTRPIKALDIGVGANCVYPLIGFGQYGWQFVGSDIETTSIAQAQRNLNANPRFAEHIQLRLQTESENIFKGLIAQDEYFDLSLCNPPFHASANEAMAGSQRKNQNLNKSAYLKPKQPRSPGELNFSGLHNELWCEGGELAFISNMIKQSQDFQNNVLWFSSLVSKQDNLKAIAEALKVAKVVETQTIAMAQGNKVSRFVAWSFLPLSKHREWKKLFA